MGRFQVWTLGKWGILPVAIGKLYAIATSLGPSYKRWGSPTETSPRARTSSSSQSTMDWSIAGMLGFSFKCGLAVTACWWSIHLKKYVCCFLTLHGGPCVSYMNRAFWGDSQLSNHHFMSPKMRATVDPKNTIENWLLDDDWAARLKPVVYGVPCSIPDV